MNISCSHCQNCKHTFIQALIGNKEEYYCEIYEENVLANDYCDKYFRPISGNAGDCIHKLGCGYIHIAKCNDYQKCKNYKMREGNMNSKELKMGDKVEVLCGNWETRIFIKYGNNGGMIATTSDSMDCFLQGTSFNTVFWLQNEWRIPKEKTYRPFTWEERDQLRGKWVKNKTTSQELVITAVTKTGVCANGQREKSYEFLFTECEFLDGSPCGILED